MRRDCSEHNFNSKKELNLIEDCVHNCWQHEQISDDEYWLLCHFIGKLSALYKE